VDATIRKHGFEWSKQHVLPTLALTLMREPGAVPDGRGNASVHAHHRSVERTADCTDKIGRLSTPRAI
jgi:hypothetical protein